ncbi:hypothetical protein P6U16_00545 [Rhizobium sp. 32-5/1]|uniref:hypothetical protein n=1 Tax=Rhizobium sp. 32-5/1 TaxID=3019602 RepID=UPI00240D741C|nr:hypothetical protein [Rhizobium sp. 32-5/1]WEZ83419.1 hypothetical protein P6U16_00545 [Rhizobium sp. 32-5/1]
MKSIRQRIAYIGASDVLVMSGTRYRSIICHPDGMIVARSDKSTAPIYFSARDLAQRLASGTLTIERSNELLEGNHG